MRLVGTPELVVIGILIVYIAFTPGLPVIRQILSTSLGKALVLAGIVAVWKYVSHPVALLLLVNYVRCSGMREFMDNPPPAAGATPPPNSYCPENSFFDMGQCKNSTTGQSVPTVTCLPSQSWDGTKCVGGGTPPPASMMPPAMPPPPATSSTAAKQPFTNLTPAMAGGVQPDIKEAMTIYAPANF